MMSINYPLANHVPAHIFVFTLTVHRGNAYSCTHAHPHINFKYTSHPRTWINSGILPNPSWNKLSGWHCCFCLFTPINPTQTSFHGVYTNWMEVYTPSAEWKNKASVLCWKCLYTHFSSISVLCWAGCIHSRSVCNLHIATWLLQFLFMSKSDFEIYGFGLCGFSILHTLVSRPLTHIYSPHRKIKHPDMQVFMLLSVTECGCSNVTDAFILE